MTTGSVKRVLLGNRTGIAGTVYGTIIVMAVITTGSASRADPGHIAGIAASTVVVLWFAHVYSDGLAESIDRGRRIDFAEVVTVARRELSIVLAAVGPTAALVLGALGVIRESRAIWLALAVGAVTLAVQGVRYARLERLGRFGTVLAVSVNFALGIAIVALEALYVH